MIEVIVEPYTGPVYERRGDSIVVIGAGPMMSEQVALIRGPVSSNGLVEVLQEKNMFGRSNGYDFGLAARDKKIAEMRRRLSLAHVSRNKTEVSRLTRELAYLGQSW